MTSFRYRIPGALLLALALHALLLLWAATSGLAGAVLAEVFEPTRLEIHVAEAAPEPLADPTLVTSSRELLADVGALEVDAPPAPESIEPEPANELAPDMLELPPPESEPPPLAELPEFPEASALGDPRALAGKKSGALGRDTRGVGARGGAAGSGNGGIGAGVPGGTLGGTGTGPFAGVVGDGVGGRVASGVPGSGTVVKPVALTTPAPGYPRLSRRTGEEGSVLCRLFLSELGEVTKVEVLESSGHERLDEAAKEALLTWRFHPRREGGRAVATTIDHRVVFQLEAG